jgi:dipeptidyl aminopeptidase/acylaminoacyl peptidase
LLPISGGGYEIETHFARYFVKRGFAVALVHRLEIGKVTPTADAIDTWLRQNIRRNQQVLDWIQTRQELDKERIGLFGISMGGIQTALLMPLDRRVKAAVFGLAAGDLPFVLSHSTEKSIRKHRAAYMKTHGLSLTEFETELRKAIHYDPASLAKYVAPDKVLLVLGVCDRVVPFKKGWELRRQLGCPETVLLPTGHYSALLCVPYVEHRCRSFFRRRLEERR